MNSLHTGFLYDLLPSPISRPRPGIGNKGYDFLEKDKDNILIDNILDILLEDIFRQLILQRIMIKDVLRIFKGKDKDKDFWAT